MSKDKSRKIVAIKKMSTAINNLKQAELEGACELAPLTYKWAKKKIYRDRKIILNLKSNKNEIEDAIDDASAAAAQLLSSTRRMDNNENKLFAPKLNEEKGIDNFINEGGPII